MENKQPAQSKLPALPSTRRTYRQPRLTILGDIRDLTLAPSMGTSESGRGPGYRSGPLDPP
jgi:hypothetical protein